MGQFLASRISWSCRFRSRRTFHSSKGSLAALGTRAAVSIAHGSPTNLIAGRNRSSELGPQSAATLVNKPLLSAAFAI